MRGAPVFAVWGHYHGWNLGDDLVVATVISAVRERIPDARFVGISLAPDDTRTRHRIDAYPIDPRTPRAKAAASSTTSGTPDAQSSDARRARLRRLPKARRVRRVLRELPYSWNAYRLLRRVDAVIVAGSGQLTDEWGPWRHPYTTLRWAILARLARTPMVMLSVGAGPIDKRLSKWLIRLAVSLSSFVSVRDRYSEELLRDLGLEGPFPVCPDMAYGLPDALLPARRTEPHARSAQPLVGVNVMAHQDPRYLPQGQSSRYDTYLAKMVSITRWLLQNGFRVRLFSSQWHSDVQVATDFTRRLAETIPIDPAQFKSTLDSVSEVDEFVGTVAECDLVIGARFHSVLVPLLLGKPVVGLAYNEKTTELLANVGRADWAFPIDSFEVEDVIELVGRLAAQGTPDEALQTEVAARRAEVLVQFDTVFGNGTDSLNGRFGTGSRSDAAASL